MQQKKVKLPVLEYRKKTKINYKKLWEKKQQNMLKFLYQNVGMFLVGRSVGWWVDSFVC